VKRQRIYIDTSVLGGCFDREFSRWSNALMEDGLFRSILRGRSPRMESDISAVDVVRRIRDDQASLLAGKSEAEVLAFFEKAREAARQEAANLAARPARQGV
jgi:hypothetical protein